jgi:hypothetical protein
MFGLGLQVHIDTIVTAMACGILYLVHTARCARGPRVFSASMFWLSGIGVGS